MKTNAVVDSYDQAFQVLGQVIVTLLLLAFALFIVVSCFKVWWAQADIEALHEKVNRHRDERYDRDREMREYVKNKIDEKIAERTSGVRK